MYIKHKVYVVMILWCNAGISVAGHKIVTLHFCGFIATRPYIYVMQDLLEFFLVQRKNKIAVSVQK